MLSARQFRARLTRLPRCIRSRRKSNSASSSARSVVEHAGRRCPSPRRPLPRRRCCSSSGLQVILAARPAGPCRQRARFPRLGTWSASRKRKPSSAGSSNVKTDDFMARRRRAPSRFLSSVSTGASKSEISTIRAALSTSSQDAVAAARRDRCFARGGLFEREHEMPQMPGPMSRRKIIAHRSSKVNRPMASPCCRETTPASRRACGRNRPWYSRASRSPSSGFDQRADGSGGWSRPRIS